MYSKKISKKQINKKTQQLKREEESDDEDFDSDETSDEQMSDEGDESEDDTHKGKYDEGDVDEDDKLSDDEHEETEEESEKEQESDEDKEDDVGSEDEKTIMTDDDDCLYRFKKQDDEISYSSEIYYEDELDNLIKTNMFVPNDERMTKPFLHTFEFVRAYATRARQISTGAKVMLKGSHSKNPKILAKLELEHGSIPLILVRTLPNGTKEKWKFSELKKIH